MKWNNKTHGVMKHARTGSYYDENETDLTPERYDEIKHIASLLVVEFIRDQRRNFDTVPANDKNGKHHSKVLVEHKKKLKKDFMERSKNGEFTVNEVSKISQFFSVTTRPLNFMIKSRVDNMAIKSCIDNLNKPYRDMLK